LDFSQSEPDLYQSLVLAMPENNVASQRFNKLVQPGDPYRSFLFRKINNGLAANVDLVSGEGEAMPVGGNALSDTQIELIRQWIVWGAPETGVVADVQQIADFYGGQGMESVQNPPTPPQQWEGLQLHLGPFFLNPGEENVTQFSGGQYARFDAPITGEKLVHKIKSFSGLGQHHYTLFSTENEQMPYGLTDNSSWFNSVKFLATAQNNIDSLSMPPGTGIPIQAENPLILNLHVFNPTAAILACDIYVNVYVQDSVSGITELLFSDNGYPDNPDNPPFVIPNDGAPHTFQYEAHDEGGSGEERFIWAMLAHSHGTTDYNRVYRRNSNGSKGDMIYDAGCPGGIPCATSQFDPEHVPTRYFDSWLAVNMNEGFIQEATYVNTTGQDLYYGPNALTAEMLVFGYYYILDTTGVVIPNGIPDHVEALDVEIYPNPSRSSDVVRICMTNLDAMTVEHYSVFNSTGLAVLNKWEPKGPNNCLDVSTVGLPSGLYMVCLQFENGERAVRKWLLTD
jgi:hypothetical protein